MAKLLKASEAIKKAKKNALARRSRMEKALREKISGRIDEMVSEGVVSVSVFLTEEEYLWASDVLEAELVVEGYRVKFTKQNEEDEEEIPDMEISIEHLK